ncbi:MAG: deoxyribonuclease IV [Actinomycetota bacterium]|nr:deoxyribonuclease IV [Actinomycetota bacterium]
MEARRQGVLIGAHIGQEDPLHDARALGLDVVQMFLGNPQSFDKPDPRPDARELREGGVPIYVHAPYRLNVCHPSPRIRVPSRKTLAQTVDAAADIGAAGVIVHGGHAEDDVGEGLTRWWKVFEEREFPTRIIIENTAGGTNAVARYVEQIARLWERLADFDVGFCFDTCHAHSAGEDLTDVVERVLAAVGKIDVLHCNDSRDAPGTGADRHTNIGKGKIDVDMLATMVKASNAPVMILETPWPGVLDDLEWLRSLIGAS